MLRDELRIPIISFEMVEKPRRGGGLN